MGPKHQGCSFLSKETWRTSNPHNESNVDGQNTTAASSFHIFAGSKAVNSEQVKSHIDSRVGGQSTKTTAHFSSPEAKQMIKLVVNFLQRGVGCFSPQTRSIAAMRTYLRRRGLPYSCDVVTLALGKHRETPCLVCTRTYCTSIDSSIYGSRFLV